MSNYIKGPQSAIPKTLVYDLQGVSNHIGGTGGGHYTAYCMNFRNEVMYSLNDAMCSEADYNMIVSKFAYLLFYKRRFRESDIAKLQRRLAEKQKKAGGAQGKKGKKGKKKRASSAASLLA